jgi:hypothetical protein
VPLLVLRAQELHEENDLRRLLVARIVERDNGYE